jgi:hypothetical protein
MLENKVLRKNHRVRTCPACKRFDKLLVKHLLFLFNVGDKKGLIEIKIDLIDELIEQRTVNRTPDDHLDLLCGISALCICKNNDADHNGENENARNNDLKV